MRHCVLFFIMIHCRSMWAVGTGMVSVSAVAFLIMRKHWQGSSLSVKTDPIQKHTVLNVLQITGLVGMTMQWLPCLLGMISCRNLRMMKPTKDQSRQLNIKDIIHLIVVLHLIFYFNTIPSPMVKMNTCTVYIHICNFSCTQYLRTNGLLIQINGRLC